MASAKSKVVFEADARELRDFDRNVKKRGSNRTWVLNSMIKDYNLIKEAETSLSKEGSKSENARSTRRS